MKNTGFEALLISTKIHIDNKDKPLACDRFCQMKDNAKSTFNKSQKADFSNISCLDTISESSFSNDSKSKSLDREKALSNSKNHNDEYFITNKVFD